MLFLGRHGNKITTNIFYPDQQKIYIKSFLPAVTFAFQLSGEHAGSVDVVCVVHLMKSNGGVMMILNEDGDDDF